MHSTVPTQSKLRVHLSLHVFLLPDSKFHEDLIDTHRFILKSTLYVNTNPVKFQLFKPKKFQQAKHIFKSQSFT